MKDVRRDPWVTLLGVAAALTVLAGVYMAFLYAPTERTQGHAQRIFYLHLPMALLSYLAFGVVFVGSVGYLWKRSIVWDRLARSAVEQGFVFTTLLLITGSLWGRPIWNAWWSWDARLTTTLILWFIYLGYFMVRAYAGDQDRAARYAAVLGIVGAIDIPIIHQSVKWWRSLHPEPVVIQLSPDLPDSMLWTVSVTILGFGLLFAYLTIQKWRIESAKDFLAERQLTRLLAGPEPTRDQTLAPRSTIAREVTGGAED